jgi:antitoxin ParD1/3/4
MGAIERVTITVPAEMADTVRKAVASGSYASTSEIIREALRAWTRRRELEEQELLLLQAAIRDGDESGQPVAADEVYARVRARIDNLRSRK